MSFVNGDETARRITYVYRRCIISFVSPSDRDCIQNGMISVWNEIRISMRVPVNHERSFRFFFLKLRKSYSCAIRYCCAREGRVESLLIIYATDVEKCNGQVCKSETRETFRNCK